MVQRIVITLSCDNCGRADETVVTHKYKFDAMRKAEEVEACSECWPGEALDLLRKVARKEGTPPQERLPTM